MQQNSHKHVELVNTLLIDSLAVSARSLHLKIMNIIPWHQSDNDHVHNAFMTSQDCVL